MNNNHKLDRYLYSLDKALGGISISEKAEIITEIKSHILAAIEDESTSIDSVLNSIGEPEQVASRYLLERGLKPNKAPFHPILKWLTIGFLGTLIVIVLFCITLVWKLSPVFTFSNNVGNLELLNGAIKLHFNTKNEDETTIRYTPNGKPISDYKIMDPKQISGVDIKFSNANLVFSNTVENKLIWNCKNTTKDGDINVIENNRIVTVDIQNLSNADCSIQLPVVLKTVISGKNGSVSIDKPLNSTSIALINGIIKIEPAETVKYYFNTQVEHGISDKFISVELSDKAIPISATVENGKIVNN